MYSKNKWIAEGKKIIWIHGASVGETQSVLPFMEDLHKKYPAFYFLITSGTVTSAKLLRSQLNPEYAVHQYMPYDNPIFIASFLRYWSPSICFRVDSDFWPITLRQIKARKIPHYIINGRMSDKSFDKYMKHPAIAKFLFEGFSGVYAKEKGDENKFKKLGFKNVKSFGNLKLDAPALTYNKDELTKFEKALKGKPLIHFAQTSDGEEEMAFAMFGNLKKMHKNLFMIITPRNIKRSDEIVKLAKKYKLDIAVRSKKQSINKNTNAYLADTMGELGLFFKLSELCFIGRSMFNNTGSNPIEPLKFHNIVFCGPNVSAFKELYNQLINEKIVMLARTPEELEKLLKEYLDDKKKRNEILKREIKFLKNNKDVGKKIMKDLSGVLNKIAK
jgi:3-deoxy-D-manno-octulosonic-acid transferase